MLLQAVLNLIETANTGIDSLIAQTPFQTITKLIERDYRLDNYRGISVQSIYQNICRYLSCAKH
jgi:hypothetical protein